MKKAFAIGKWWVEPQLNRISNVGEVETLGPKVMDALVLLAERKGNLVGKEELVERVWKGAFISDEALTTLVYELRKALGDVARVKRYVGTVRGRGYRLLTEVREHPQLAPSEEKPGGSRPEWQVRWAAVAFGIALASLAWISFPPLSEGPRTHETRTLAVLHLIDASGDSQFSKGLTESLASQLARDDHLEVFDAFSSLNPPSSRLETEAFVQGRVERLGDHISVSVRLLDAGGRLLWGGTFEQSAVDSGELRRQLAFEIAHQVRHQLLPNRGRAANADAQQAFQVGRFLLEQVESQAIDLARDQFELAIEWDPTFARAHVGLAEALLAEAGESAPGDRQVSLHEAKEAVEKAIEIDDTLAEAHDTLADIYFRHDWNWVGAEREYRLSCQPSDCEGESARGYAQYLSARGRHDEAIDILASALSDAPAWTQGRMDLAQIHYRARRYDDALSELARLDELLPGSAFVPELEGRILLAAGRPLDALEACRRLLAIEGSGDYELEDLDEEFRSDGEEALLRCLVELAFDRDDIVDPVRLAALEALRGDLPSSLSWLEHAERSRHEDLVWVDVDPAFDNLRGVPAFRDIKKRIGFS